MPKNTVVEMPPAGPVQMPAALRRARYGELLARHLLLWCAAGRTPTALAAALFCSRSRVDRTLRAYRRGTLGWERDAQGRLLPPRHPTVPLPTRRRSLRALLQAPPPTSGWCRARGSGATLALTWQTTRRGTVSPETMRRGLHALGWGGEARQTWSQRRRPPPRRARGPPPRGLRAAPPG
jgi:hypothetical protein